MTTSRSAGRLQLSLQAGLSDHAACSYSTDDERAHIAATWIADGLRAGQRALYVAEGSVEQLAAELAAVPHVSEAIASGAVMVVPSTELYDLSTPIDADAQLALYAGVVDQALADGYTGLRVAADITPLVLDPSRHEAHVHWEQVADRYMTDHPLAPICMYDSRRVDGVSAIASVHPLQGPSEPLFALYGVGPTRAALYGEIDCFGTDTFAAVLRGLPATDEVMELAGLSFVDGRAVATINAELIRRRTSGQELTLTGASSMFRRVWDICGYDEAALG
jgi:hypothetical protein